MKLNWQDKQLKNKNETDLVVKKKSKKKVETEWVGQPVEKEIRK